MLYVALYLPQLALDVFLRARISTLPSETEPESTRPGLVRVDAARSDLPRPGAARPGAARSNLVIEASGRVPVVYACDSAARAYGIRPKMKLSAALALQDDVRIHPRDEAKARRALAQLAEWALQFTPTVTLEPPNALLLEIEGCLDYFGGLVRLLRLIEHGMSDLGYVFRSAVAPSCYAAVWLARYRPGARVLDLRQLESALNTLPVAALPLPEDKLDQFNLIGVRDVGQVLALPRAGLAKRFGTALTQILDRAIGSAPDPRPVFEAPDVFNRRIELQWAADKTDDLLFIGKRLLIELAGFLAGRGMGVQTIDVHLHHRDHPKTLLRVGFGKPTRQADQMFAVLRERFERFTLPDPVAELEIAANDLQRLDAIPFDLFGDASRHDELELLHARLKARLGEQAVRFIATQADHRPEKAWRHGEAPSGGPTVNVGDRPYWLLDPPRALSVQNERPWYGETLLCIGRAERIESGWWDGEPIARDYFLAIGASGRRYWVFQQRSDHRWFLHGLFD